MGAVQSRLHDDHARPRAEPVRAVRKLVQLRRAKRQQLVQLHVHGVQRGQRGALGGRTAARPAGQPRAAIARGGHRAISACRHCCIKRDHCGHNRNQNASQIEIEMNALFFEFYKLK